MTMTIKQYFVYLADLEPSFGSEPGKIRPVTVIQTNLLNDAGHRTTLICPLTTQLFNEADAFPLRLYLNKKETGFKMDSDVLVDQIRSIDNRRLIKKIGKLTPRHQEKLRRHLKIVLFD